MDTTSMDIGRFEAELKLTRRQCREFKQRRKRADERAQRLSHENDLLRVEVDTLKAAARDDVERRQEPSVQVNNTEVEQDDEEDDETTWTGTDSPTSSLLQTYEAKLLNLQHENARLDAIVAAKDGVDPEARDRQILLEAHQREMMSISTRFDAVERIAYDLVAAVDMLDINSRASELRSIIDITKEVSRKLVEAFEENVPAT